MASRPSSSSSSSSRQLQLQGELQNPDFVAKRTLNGVELRVVADDAPAPFSDFQSRSNVADETVLLSRYLHRQTEHELEAFRKEHGGAVARAGIAGTKRHRQEGAEEEDDDEDEEEDDNGDGDGDVTMEAPQSIVQSRKKKRRVNEEHDRDIGGYVSRGAIQSRKTDSSETSKLLGEQVGVVLQALARAGLSPEELDKEEQLCIKHHEIAERGREEQARLGYVTEKTATLRASIEEQLEGVEMRPDQPDIIKFETTKMYKAVGSLFGTPIIPPSGEKQTLATVLRQFQGEKSTRLSEFLIEAREAPMRDFTKLIVGITTGIMDGEYVQKTWLRHDPTILEPTTENTPPELLQQARYRQIQPLEHFAAGLQFSVHLFKHPEGWAQLMAGLVQLLNTIELTQIHQAVQAIVRFGTEKEEKSYREISKTALKAGATRDMVTTSFGQINKDPGIGFARLVQRARAASNDGKLLDFAVVPQQLIDPEIRLDNAGIRVIDVPSITCGDTEYQPLITRGPVGLWCRPIVMNDHMVLPMMYDWTIDQLATPDWQLACRNMMLWDAKGTDWWTGHHGGLTSRGGVYKDKYGRRMTWPGTIFMGELIARSLWHGANSSANRSVAWPGGHDGPSLYLFCQHTDSLEGIHRTNMTNPVKVHALGAALLKCGILHTQIATAGIRNFTSEYDDDGEDQASDAEVQDFIDQFKTVTRNMAGLAESVMLLAGYQENVNNMAAFDAQFQLNIMPGGLERAAAAAAGARRAAGAPEEKAEEKAGAVNPRLQQIADALGGNVGALRGLDAEQLVFASIIYDEANPQAILSARTHPPVINNWNMSALISLRRALRDTVNGFDDNLFELKRLLKNRSFLQMATETRRNMGTDDQPGYVHFYVDMAAAMAAVKKVGEPQQFAAAFVDILFDDPSPSRQYLATVHDLFGKVAIAIDTGKGKAPNGMLDAAMRILPLRRAGPFFDFLVQNRIMPPIVPTAVRLNILCDRAHVALLRGYGECVKQEIQGPLAGIEVRVPSAKFLISARTFMVTHINIYNLQLMLNAAIIRVHSGGLTPLNVHDEDAMSQYIQRDPTDLQVPDILYLPTLSSEQIPEWLNVAGHQGLHYHRNGPTANEPLQYAAANVVDHHFGFTKQHEEQPWAMPFPPEEIDNNAIAVRDYGAFMLKDGKVIQSTASGLLGEYVHPGTRKSLHNGPGKLQFGTFYQPPQIGL